MDDDRERCTYWLACHNFTAGLLLFRVATSANGKEATACYPVCNDCFARLTGQTITWPTQEMVNAGDFGDGGDDDLRDEAYQEEVSQET